MLCKGLEVISPEHCGVRHWGCPGLGLAGENSRDVKGRNGSAGLIIIPPVSRVSRERTRAKSVSELKGGRNIEAAVESNNDRSGCARACSDGGRNGRNVNGAVGVLETGKADRNRNATTKAADNARLLIAA